ncbi:MAG TPA: hypothetical protein VKD65_04580 [Candidatus Angelobacter sp.]|nr:hypothetical protein [Candidatus Angelobacter sp.]
MAKRARKPKARTPTDLSKQMWINPHSNLKGPEGDRAWNNQGNISPGSGARFLELADVALGLKHPPAALTKKKPHTVVIHTKKLIS